MARVRKLRNIVALNAARTPLGLLRQAKGIVKKMTGNPWFPSPKPSLASVQGCIDALDAAQTRTATHAPGTADARNAKKDALQNALQKLQAHVQSVADATPESARIIIASSGFALKKSSAKKPKAAFAVTPGKTQGSARLVATAVAKRASYEWYMSQDGKTWTRVRTSLAAKTTVTGLTLGATYCFRFRGVTKKGPGRWSQTIRFIAR